LVEQKSKEETIDLLEILDISAPVAPAAISTSFVEPLQLRFPRHSKGNDQDSRHVRGGETASTGVGYTKRGIPLLKVHTWASSKSRSNARGSFAHVMSLDFGEYDTKEYGRFQLWEEALTSQGLTGVH